MIATDRSKNKKGRADFIVRHREPFWAYQRSQICGPAYLNYVHKNGRRSLRLHIKIKTKREDQQISVLIPLPLMYRLIKRVARDGPINHRQKITFEKLRIVTRAADPDPTRK